MDDLSPLPAADALPGAASAPATPLPAASAADACARPPEVPDTEVPDDDAPNPLAATLRKVPRTLGDDDPQDDPEDQDAPPAYDDPEEYRWVPVRRKPRYDGWSPEKQRRFIEVLADTGSVAAAADAVSMTRESAYRLRRSAHAAEFARAWDAARHHAGSFLEDVAFERAVDGAEHNVYDELGNVICTKRVYNDRLLMFLLRHLKPERYGSPHSTDARSVQAAQVTQSAPPTTPAVAHSEPAPALTVDASLRAMEPQLPAPIETLLDFDTLCNELDIAEAADGIVPHFLSGIPIPKTPEQRKAAADAAQIKRGEEVWNDTKPTTPRSHEDFVAMTRYIDPAGWNQRLTNKRYR